MSEPVVPNQDAEHLRLLAIFHYVCAGVIAVVACMPILHLVLGLVFLFLPETMEATRPGPPPKLFGLIFALFGGAAVLIGWAVAALVAWSGRCLARRRHHTFCLVMAGILCMFMPVGTVLGVFTIIVLVRPSVKARFETGAPG